MTILVDDLVHYSYHPHGHYLWCHLATDGDLAELHAFAARIGLSRTWFQESKVMPHYDLTAGKSWLALKLGAVAVSNEELIERCRSSRGAKE